MTKKIYSKVDSDILLATILELPTGTGRVDASDSTEILQVSQLCLSKDRAVKSHRHVPVERTTTGTQESWIVITGSLKVEIYDVNDQPVDTADLTAGACLTLFRGGHNLTVLSDNTVFYEVKNGPYYGPELDRVQL